MGIKNLLKFLSNYPDILKEKNINDYYGKRIAIDISILLYQVVIAVRNTGSDLINNEGIITSHILGLFNKTISFLECGIIPIYVFDGKPPQLKKNVLSNRNSIRIKAENKLLTCDNENDKIKYLKRCVKISREQLDQCRELLHFMGIPYIDASQEADSELSHLCKSNLVYAVLTEDMDILTFGSPRIIRNLTSHKKIPLEIELDDILNKLKLTYEQFIDLCILFGCDYTQNLDIRINDIYKVYNKHKTIEGTIKELRKRHYISNNFEYKDIKQYFISSPHQDITENMIKINKPNINKLEDLLVNKYGFVRYIIINKLNKLSLWYETFKNY